MFKRNANWILLFIGLACSFTLEGGDLKIHVINVGWGSSVLLEGPTGRHVLLEAGNSGLGKSRVVPYLQAKGFQALDAVLLGHMHQDHGGGLQEVGDAGFKAPLNYWNGSSGGSSTVHAWVTATGATILNPGNVLDLGGGATATCVASNGAILGLPGNYSGGDENDNSIALLVNYKSFEYLWESDLGGAKDADDTCSSRSTSQMDLEVPMIKAISPGGAHPLLPATGVDVIHVGHHGSQSSSHPLYLRMTHPQLALISTGRGQSGTWALPYIQTVDGVLLSGVNGCAGVEAPLVLQTEDGDMNYNNQRSTSGHAVGNIVVRTDGAHYWVSCNSDNGDAPFIATGTLPEERQAAGIPLGTEREFTCKAAGAANTITASISEPASDLTVAPGSSVGFVGSAKDSSPSATLSYAWDFGDGTNASGTSASHAFSNSGAAALTRTVTFTAVDGSGALGSATRAVIVASGGDAQPPTISVLETGSTGSIAFSATASDNVGVTKVEFYVDGALQGTATASPYTLTVDSTTLTAGVHTLTGKAYDGAGNVGTSASVSFTVIGTPVTYNEVESNNTQATANAVPGNVTQILGYLNSASDNDDWFTLTVPAGHTLTLDMTGPTASQQVYYLYLNSGTSQVAKSTNASTTQHLSYKNTATTSKSLTIDVHRITSYSRVTPYTLNVGR